jgi:HEAT repeat protein
MNESTDNMPEPVGDDPLDQLLSEARWPAATPKAQARLANHWQDAWLAQRRWERLAQRATVVAIAASLLIAVVVGWGWRQHGRQPVAQPDTVQRTAPRTDSGKATTVVKEIRVPRSALHPVSPTPSDQAVVHSVEQGKKPLVGDSEEIRSRPPTKLEELLIAAWDTRPHERSKLSQAPAKRLDGAQEHPPATASAAHNTTIEKASTAPDLVGQAIAQLVSAPKTDPAVAAAGLQKVAAESETRLLAILGSDEVAEQTAAMRLLGEVGSSASVPELLRAVGETKLHTAAIDALSRIADAQTINQLVRDETSLELRRVLLAALLGRGEPASLSSYLSYVASKEYGATALAATELVSNPPMERLFAALNSTSEFDRLAAARVLGRIDGPETTQRLITLLEQGQNRQEACVALLSSRGEEAATFVSSAQTNPTLATLLQAASVLISHDSQPRS